MRVNRGRSPISSAFGVVLALSGVLFSAHDAIAQPRSNSDYCSSNGRVIVFAVDLTTPYDATDKKAIEELTDGLLRQLKGGDQFIVRTILESSTRSEKIIDRCVPRCSSESEIGKWFTCTDGIVRTDTNRFRSEVISALRTRLTKFEEQKFSDIVRTIVRISNEDHRDEREFKLFMYSDMVENSDYFLPKYLFEYPTPRLIYGIQHYKQVAKLTGVTVNVAGVGRSDSKDRRPLSIKEREKLIDFWRAYFEASGAKSVSITQASF